jgi:hypothetical protein
MDIEKCTMRHAIFPALVLALSSSTAMADTDASDNLSDEQKTCAATAARDYEIALAVLAHHSIAGGGMSIEDTIAQRRLSENFCERWAACLVASITEPGIRNIALRATFVGCLSGEMKGAE